MIKALPNDENVTVDYYKDDGLSVFAINDQFGACVAICVEDIPDLIEILQQIAKEDAQ